MRHNLLDKRLLILGSERGKKRIPILRAKEKIEEGDKLVVYGRLHTLKHVFGPR